MKSFNIKIKICGLKDVLEVQTVARLGVYWYGMIFVKQSPRFITYKQAEVLIKHTPNSIRPVAVIANPTDSEISNIIKLGIKNIQLHGNESPKFCLQLKEAYKFNIIKAISIKSLSDLKLIDMYKGFSDWILFDYKDEKKLGGTGKKFDWNLLANKNLNFQWILSGGLDYNNVKVALEKTSAQAIDISSGVENEKGKKSIKLIKKFCNVLHRDRFPGVDSEFAEAVLPVPQQTSS